MKNNSAGKKPSHVPYRPCPVSERGTSQGFTEDSMHRMRGFVPVAPFPPMKFNSQISCLNIT